MHSIYKDTYALGRLYYIIGKLPIYIKNCACIASLQHPPSNLGQMSCPITELKGAHAECFVLKLSKEGAEFTLERYLEI